MIGIQGNPRLRMTGLGSVDPREKQIGGGKVTPCYRSPGREDGLGIGKWMLGSGRWPC